MFHVCCKGVLEECFKAFFVLISRVLQGCIEIVLRMLPGGFKVFFYISREFHVQRVFQGGFNSDSMAFQLVSM